MAISDIILFLLSFMAIASAAMVAFHPNVLYAAVSLIFTLVSVGGLFASLGADFLAAAQLIIYVGGVIIVILFAIMMSENIYRTRFIDGAKKYFLPIVGAAFVFVGLLGMFLKTPWVLVSEISRANTSEAIGRALVGPYALVFQYVAIVLLMGLIGAVIVARPNFKKNKEEK